MLSTFKESAFFRGVEWHWEIIFKAIWAANWFDCESSGAEMAWPNEFVKDHLEKGRLTGKQVRWRGKLSREDKYLNIKLV